MSKPITQDKVRYWLCVGLAFISGSLSVWYILAGVWIYVAFAYVGATLARLAAGMSMIDMGNAEAVNAWNNCYHRFVVIALNSIMGLVLLGRLAWDAFQHHTHVGLFTLLVCAFIAYFIGAKFTRPNTFGARVRSAVLTIVLVCTMANLAWRQHWGLWILTGVIALSFTWLRLRALQRRFGWADR